MTWRCALHLPTGPDCARANLQLDAVCYQYAFIQEQGLGIRSQTPVMTCWTMSSAMERSLPSRTAGMMAIPGGPGLGIEVNEAYCARACRAGPPVAQPGLATPWPAGFAEWCRVGRSSRPKVPFIQPTVCQHFQEPAHAPRRLLTSPSSGKRCDGDPPAFAPRFQYFNHENTFAQIEPFFLVCKSRICPTARAGPVERCSYPPTNGTHLDAPYPLHSTMDEALGDEKPAIAIHEVPLESVLPARRQAGLPAPGRWLCGTMPGRCRTRTPRHASAAP